MLQGLGVIQSTSPPGCRGSEHGGWEGASGTQGFKGVGGVAPHMEPWGHPGHQSTWGHNMGCEGQGIGV